MAKKMYYSEEEAAAKLGVSPAEIARYVADKKLRAYPDGARKMYKVEEVDAIAPAAEEVQLVAEGASLSEADKPKVPTKEDTVITAEGISIFDDEDLEIEQADPMAKTQIAPSVEDEAAIEGVGSGSGLLDLTRESDDTSLGAEVLDHIDMEGAVGSGLEAEVPASSLPSGHAYGAVVEAPVVEAIDPMSGLFGGIVAGCAIIALLLIMAAASLATEQAPNLLMDLKKNMGIGVLVSLVIVAALAAIGMVVGKSAAARKLALRQMGK